MSDINELRNQIDHIDASIKELFLQRMAVCREVGRYKAEKGLPVLDAKREKELLESKLKDVNIDERQSVKKFFECIMDISKDEQKRICTNSTKAVGFCGVIGAYGYFAAKTIGDKVQAYSSFKEVAMAVESGEIDRGVLPIENTTAGSVLDVYDILGESSLYIVGEIVTPVSHSLLGLGTIDEVKTVCSHPQALSQCSDFLGNKGYELLQSVNTAIAAKECKEKGDRSIGVIASSMCGELYGLNVLKENIEDKKGNKTRFVEIARKIDGRSYGNKASVTFTLPHRQGSLVEMLNHFKDINLCKIESRPVGNFEYRFYLDFITENPDAVLDKITSVYNTVKVLGIYKSNE